jgi:alpha-L-arabinofuranosidase
MNTLHRFLSMATLPILAQAAPLQLELDLARQEAPINPMIYGQFIEHLGRCIYGGIWAEMLEDRKFYFEISPTYAPYTRLEDTAFPVIGASPWEIMGKVEGLNMTTEDSFVGDHTPHLEAGTGIRQHDLSWEEGRGYEGYVWLKRSSEQHARVKVRLGGVARPASFEFIASGDDYQKFYFHWTGTADSAKGTFEVEVAAGSVFIGTASIMPDDNVRGMRADTVALLKELDAPIYRWPGGNFVSGYDWRDGVGDRDRRPPRRNPAWEGVEHNDFGTEEFIDFCRTIGAEPVVTANMGFGDAYSAAQWVEYCNAGGETIGGKMRIDHGHDKPFDVRYWCVGNEMWGSWQLGYMHLDQYVLKHNRAARAMWDVDPGLVLVGSGDLSARSKGLNSDRERGWSEGLLEESGQNMDLIAEHFYDGRTPWSDLGREPLELHVTRIAESIREIADGHRALQPRIKQLEGRVVPIAMTEWNYWHREYEYGELGCIYDLQDGLGIAAGLHEFFRQSDLIQMAYYAQTVNVIGAIKTSRTAAEFESTGLVLKLYRAHFGDLPLSLTQDFGPLDVVAALADGGKVLTVAVMNPQTSEVELKLNLRGGRLAREGRKFWVTGPSPEAFNTPGEDRRIDEHSATLEPGKGLVVPALSATVFRLPLE